MATVHELKAQLEKTGFLRKEENKDDNRDYAFRRAVREFQRYASLNWAAQRKMPAPAPFTISAAFQSFQLAARHQYKSAISGNDQDASTQAALQAWTADNLYCPVILQVCFRDKHSNELVPGEGSQYYGFWEPLTVPTAEEAKLGQRLVLAWDFSQHFVPDSNWQGPVVVSKVNKLSAGTRYAAYADFPPSTNPCTDAYQAQWPQVKRVPDSVGLDTEILPESLAGQPFESLNPYEQSLFRIIRAVSEVECFGYFDSLNAYDRAVMSIGICHWTLTTDGTTSRGELAGLLSLFNNLAPPEESAKLLQKFGVGVDKPWHTDEKPDGQGLLNAEQGTYVTRLTTAYTEEVSEYRGWHWVYRFSMALRTLPTLRRAMWQLTRKRLENILDQKFATTAGIGAGARGSACYGDVFRSEQAVALLLRWHVNKPAVVMGAQRNAAKQRIDWLGPLVGRVVPPVQRLLPTDRWAPAVQQALAQALALATARAMAPGFGRTLQQVTAWPRYKGRNPGYKKKQPFASPLQAIGNLTFPYQPPIPLPVAPVMQSDVPNVLTEQLQPAAPAEIADALFPTPNPLSPPLAAASERLVLRGYTDDGQEDFQVLSRRTAGPGGGDELVLLQHGTPTPVPDLVQPERLTRLEFWEGVDLPATGLACLWEVVVPQGYVQQLSIRSGKLEFAFSVRVFIVADLRHLLLRGTLAHLDAQGMLGFENLKAPGIGAEVGKVPFSEEGLNNMQLRGQQEGELTFAQAIDIDVDTRRKKTITITLPATRSATRRHVFSIRADIGLAKKTGKPPTLRYRPFDLNGKFDDADAGGDGFRYFLSFWQRQPASAPLRSVLGHQWLVEVEVPWRCVERLWRPASDKLISAIGLVEAGRNLSFLPRFEFKDQPDADEELIPDWRAVYFLLDRLQADGTASANSFVVQPPAGGALGKVAVYGRQLTPKIAAKEQPTNGHLAFPALRHADWQPATATTWYRHSAQLSSYAGNNSDLTDWESGLLQPADSFGIGFSYQELVPFPLVLGSQVRLQGLSLWLPKPQDAALQPGHLLNRVHLLLGLLDHTPVGLALDIGLTTVRFGPAGQDDLPGEEFEVYAQVGGTAVPHQPAILINLAPAAATDTLGNYVLGARETFSADSSHDLGLRLSQHIEQRNRIDILMLDPEPLSVVRVRSDDLGGDLAAGTEIANWAYRPGEGAYSWQVRLPDNLLQLLLPPQALGEAMHRRIDAEDISPNQPIDARFGLPADVQLLASDFGSEFAELPWNLRRRLGYPGQLLPGARLSRLTVELLYGMVSTITHPRLRLSEIQARLGQPPSYLPGILPWSTVSQDQAARYQDFRQGWHQLRDALRTRPALWEPYDPAEETLGQPFSGQRLTLRSPQDLRVRLDPTAELAYPVPGATPPENLASHIPHRPDGLKGSFAWAFESANVYHQLWREQEATEAELTGLQLSSLGGSGQLKASFAGGNITITSAITLGRVDSLQVEVRGRISHFWNRARYVVVYERTVAGTRQFMTEQYPLLGWPVLRKTQEYIEIDQPERMVAGSDADEATWRAASLVQGCLFPAVGGQPPRINVNGRWGQDVGTIGWRVPLWVRGAAPADVYPMPDVRVLCAADQDGQTTACPIDDPEKLFFFTLTTDPPSPPDSWGPIPGIDNVPVPAEAFPTGALADSDVLATVPGLGDFTLTLGVARPLNLVQGRQAEGIVAHLRTITVMRGPLVPEVVPTDKDAREVFDALRAAQSAADQALNTLLPARQAPAEAPPHPAAKTVSIADIPIASAIKEAANGFCTNASSALKLPGDWYNRQLAEAQSRLLGAYHAGEASLRQAATSELLAAAAQVSALAKTLLANIPPDQALSPAFQAQLLALVDKMVGQGVNDTTGVDDAPAYTLKWQLARLRGTPGESSQLIEEALAVHDEQVEQVLDDLGAAVEEIRQQWQACLNSGDAAERAAYQQQATKLLTSLAASLQQVADTLLTGVAEATRRWLGTQPNTAQVQVAASYNQLRLALLALRTLSLPADAPNADVIAALGRLAVVQTQLLQAWTDPASLAGFADKLLTQATAYQALVSQLLTEAAPFAALAEGWLQRLKQVIQSADTTAANLPQRLTDAVTAYVGELLQNTAQELAQDLNNLRLGLEREARQALTALLPEVAQLQAYYSEGADYFRQVAEQLQTLGGHTERVLLDYLDSITGDIRTSANGLLAYTKAALFGQLPDLSQLPQGTTAQATLSLLRAFGQAPRVPGLSFGTEALQGVAYRFLEGPNLKTAAHVAMTELSLQAGQTARQLLDEATKVLAPVNLAFSTREIAERFLPNLDNLRNLRLGQLLPNLAGLPLKELLGSITIPPEAAENVKVRQQYDQQSRTRQVYIDLRLRLPNAVPLLNVAGITLRLLPGTTLAATVSVEVPDANPTQVRSRASGEITGNWELLVGTLSLAQLVNTTLRFDENGRLHFNITPERIRLQQILDFITRALPILGQADSGLSVKITPTGARTTLSLPLPNIQAGTFGISNLYLGFLFGVDLSDGFHLLAGLAFGRQGAPFTLTVFILGGAGWVEFEADYRVKPSQLQARVSIALFASAGIGINLGPISGGIYAYLGVTAEFRTGQSMTLGVLILFTGSVSLLGLVRVSLSLQLQADYRDGQLVGRGRVEYKIKLGWLITIKVKANVAYAFGKSASQRPVESLAAKQAASFLAVDFSAPAQESAEELAEQYLNMFDFTV